MKIFKSLVFISLRSLVKILEESSGNIASHKQETECEGWQC